MKPQTPVLPPEVLLGQADFVRALSRSLLADPSAAEDVAQEALVAGLEQPPTEAGALRGWLARVVRNLVLQRGRGEARRASREHAAAKAERIPSTAEVLEREAARAAVVRAVLALEEPYRATVLLRFYESRAPREIAAQLGVPVETVHTRTQRALAQLRERLDHEFGQRSAWAALLVPFTRSPVGPTGERVPVPSSSPNQKNPSMHPALKLAGLGAVLVAGAAYWLRSGLPERAPASPVQAVTVVASPAADSTGTPATEHADARRSPLAPSPAPAASAAPAASEPAPPARGAFSTGSLRLTVTWSDGTAAAGVQARVTDVGRNSYDPLEACTDTAGECTVAGLRAGKVWVTLDRKALWSFAEVAADDETELAIQLEDGWNVEGVVVAANGDAVEGAVVWLGHPTGTPESAFAVTSSATDGSFAVRSCPDLAYLWARAPGHAPSLVRTIEETRIQPEGTSVSITLALGGADASVAGVVRDAEGNPVEGALVLVDGQDMLHAFPQTLPGGQQIYVSRSGPTCVRTDANGNFAVAGVLPGTVPLGVLAPGLAAWRGSLSVAAGETGTKEITLTTGFRLVGTVHDGAGNPVGARVQIWAPRLSSQLSPTVMTGSDGGFEIDGISPGEIHVNVDCAVGVASATLTGQAGEELTWDAILEPEGEDDEVSIESEPWE